MTQKKSDSDSGEPLTLDDLFRVGLGCLHFTPPVFYDMDFVDCIHAVQGYQDQQNQAEQMHWERVRWQTAALLSPHAKGGKGMKPTDLIRFPWDNLQSKRKPAPDPGGAALLMKIAKLKK